VISSNVFSVGNCPVCADFGGVLLLTAVRSGKHLFLCPMCGTAWAKPPGVDVDAVDTVDDIVGDEPVRLATQDEVLASGYAASALDVALREDWGSALETCLADRFHA
jgi:hypothetical protein